MWCFFILFWVQIKSPTTLGSSRFFFRVFFWFQVGSGGGWTCPGVVLWSSFLAFSRLGVPQKQPRILPRFWRSKKEWKDFFFRTFWCWILLFFLLEANSAVVPLYVVCWLEISHVPFSVTWTGCGSIYSDVLCKSKNWNQAWNYIFLYRHIILNQWWQVVPKKHFRK